MKKSEERFRLQRFVFESHSGGTLCRYMITDNLLPMLEINQWIEGKSLRKSSTGKEYAKKLVVYLNYLHAMSVEYDEATNRHVKQFVGYLLYGDCNLKSRFFRCAAADTANLCNLLAVSTQLAQDYLMEANRCLHLAVPPSCQQIVLLTEYARPPPANPYPAA